MKRHVPAAHQLLRLFTNVDPTLAGRVARVLEEKGLTSDWNNHKRIIALANHSDMPRIPLGFGGKKVLDFDGPDIDSFGHKMAAALVIAHPALS